MSRLEIHQFICRSDNFGVIIHDSADGVTASIDAPDGEAVRRELAAKGWRLTHIFVTHHHADHTEGIATLKAETGCRVIGPRAEAARIPTLDQQVAEGDEFKLGSHKVGVLDTPGHTAGHITFVMADDGVAFAGDALFVMGCGRVIEGNPRMMWESLSKLAALPADTKVYCGHEYTVANARFAATIEPENAALMARLAEVEALRADGKLTQPTTIARELETNPFLRPSSPAIRARLAMAGKADWEVFAEIRERKNRG